MSPDHTLERLARPRPAVAWAIAAVLVAAWGVLRLAVFQSFILPLTYALPLLVCVWTRSRRMLWTMAGFFVAMHVVKQAVLLSPGALTREAAVWSFAATLFNILVAALAVELIIRLRVRLEGALTLAEEKRKEAAMHAATVREQAAELVVQNEELSRQAEELSQQTEELTRHGVELGRQSDELAAQNEELKAQSEEIQALNAELGRREELLQSLLEAARGVGHERAAADRLCTSALELVGAPGAVAVVREQREGQLVVIGSAGVPQASALAPSERFEATFAELVMRQGRAASLTDGSLRPDLALLELAGGRRFRSVLAAPIPFPGFGVGVIEVYGHVQHEWTEEQYRLVRWLALQGSQILATLRLQDGMRRQAALIELSPDATIVQDGEGRITFWSRGAEALYGWTREQALGRTTGELLHTRPDVSGIRQLVLEQGRATCELAHTTRDGREVTVESRWLAQPSGPGGTIEFLESNTDITERKKAEEALRRADQHKSRFLATLSHELRNPLAPIRYALQVLAQASVSAGAVNDGGSSQAIGVIERQLAHLVRLVDDLLDLTRIASNKIRLRKRLVRLDGIVGQAVEAALPAVEQAGQELVISMPPRQVWLEADAERLAQVLINLLNNAARYTPDGGTITVAAAVEGDEVVLSVKDTGIGLRKEDLPRLFEMFSQVGGEGRGGGLGIGLALVKGIVELHGGAVEARSAGVGLGSEFLARLPLAEGPASQPADQQEPSFRAPRHVLVVDDNLDAAHMMKAMLELDGHLVRVAHDGPSALAAARELVPDVVLLDIGLPSMDGYEVARGLRADQGMRGVHLVAVTGWGQEEDRARARASGFDAHLTKPADPAEVRRLVACAAPRAQTTGVGEDDVTRTP